MSSVDNDSILRCATALRNGKRLAILTGAGVSAESGVPTFRASDGLWEGHRIEDVASPEGFDRNAKLVWEFYNGRRANLTRVSPNPGHHALASLEELFGERFDLITQNVDGLHQAAGNQRVHELHGNIRQTRCTECGDVADHGLETLPAMPECPHCGGLLRPQIVWFGEMLPPDVWEKALHAVMECDTFLVVGTSAVVHPAAGLIGLARRRRTPTVIEVNLDRTVASDEVDIGLYGPSGVVLPQVLEAYHSLA
jgi:NAD-dependent deacetylase